MELLEQIEVMPLRYGYLADRTVTMEPEAELEAEVLSYHECLMDIETSIGSRSRS